MRSATSSLAFTLIFLGLFALVKSNCSKGEKCATAENCETSDCMVCGTGQYQATNGFSGTTCGVCPAGTEYTSKTTACKTCGAGKYQIGPPSTIGCQEWDICSTGQKVSVLPSLETNRACVTCDTGMYMPDSRNELQVCKFCPAGKTYSNRDTCNNCANGKYQLDDELVTTGSCKTCVKGKHWTARDTACGICAAGTYQNLNNPGMTDCKDCDAGRYLIDDSVDAANHVAEADCLFCAAGTSPTTKTELCVSILI